LPKDSPRAYFVDIAWSHKIFGRNAYSSNNRQFESAFEAMEAINLTFESEGAELDEETNYRITRSHPNTHHRLGRVPVMLGPDGQSLHIMNPLRQYRPSEWEFITDEGRYHSIVFTINIALQH
jgi:hypothetical protein